MNRLAAKNNAPGARQERSAWQNVYGTFPQKNLAPDSFKPRGGIPKNNFFFALSPRTFSKAKANYIFNGEKKKATWNQQQHRVMTEDERNAVSDVKAGCCFFFP